MNKIVFPLKLRMRRQSVADLQDGLRLLMDNSVLRLSDAERQTFVERLHAERASNLFGQATGGLVRSFQEQRRLRPTGEVDERTAKALNEALEELEPFQPPTPGQPPPDTLVRFQVEGRVASRVSAGVGGLRVDIVDKGVGKDCLLVRTETDEKGAYQATYGDTLLSRRGKAQPDLQALVFAGDTPIGASAVRYNASSSETLNVLLDEKATSALRSEHETLTGNLSSHFKGRLGDLQETDDRQDITYLANKTGWDARAVALAALADQFSARAVTAGAGAMEPAFFYALFRAGLPASEAPLYQTETKSVEAVCRQAIAQGVIPASFEQRLSQALEQFRELAAQRALSGPSLVGLSPLKELLSVSLGEDQQRQEQFADLYIRHRADPPKFWEAVRGAFGEPAERRLKLDGQLAYLTLNNAPLIRKLHSAAGGNGLNSVLDVVEEGYHRAAKWEETIGHDPIPPEMPGADDAEKRARYSELLAALVRLSFPTAVVAQTVKSGETPLANGDLKDQVHRFLTEHQGKFELGMQPVEQYAVRNDLQVAPEVTREITRIQRVYQITQGDDAMNALLKRGLDSAYAVVRYDRDEFVRAFQNEVGGEASARLIYSKSQQVHNAVLNIAVSYLTAANAPAVGMHSPAAILDPAPNPHASDVIAYSTLEGLVGAMDYCECEHCRSILSPAAYLVDLLLFLDREEQAWQVTCDKWRDEHAGAPYPFADMEAWNRYQDNWNDLHPGRPIPNTEITPLQVLLSRRPDIQCLPLTCENTNTPLPYIDLVNETLEYYVTNNLSLADYRGHTTDSSGAPAELLANPQFVSDKAYEIIAGEPAQAGGPRSLFPPPLPFHQSLENLRRYFDKFEVPLPRAMEALRQSDDIERPNAADPAHHVEYGWRDILMEELRLSRVEYALLTDHALTLQQLYGYPPATPDADVLAGLAKVKDFTRRLRISYEDIIEILKTRFVNPNSTLIPKLERLRVTFAMLKKLKDGAITDEEFNASLPPDIEPGPYGIVEYDVDGNGNPNIAAWVKNEANYANIMGLITLANPEAEEDLCSFDKLEFHHVNPDNTANKVRPFEFVRLLRFIRLWKKLGWTIEQTDKVITALYPADQTPNDADDAVNLQRLDDGFLTLLPRLGVVKRVIDLLKLKPKRDLLPLLACFAPIDTHGAASLYREMFLSPALRKQDKAFADNGYGNFLTDNTMKLVEHVETLRAAFLLTDDEFSSIAAALAVDASTSLSVDSITEIYRRGWLARKLRFSVRELLLLIQSSGLDPFASPSPPNPGILRLIELVGDLRAASLKPVEALYVIWNHDISGKSVPDDDTIAGFARTLRSDLAAIEGEFALADDPGGQMARERMAQVYGNEATDLFFGLLNNSVLTDVEYTHDQETLQQEILDAAPGTIAYDNLRKRLSYSKGVMPDAIRDALRNVAGVAEGFKTAVDKLHKETRTFFDGYPRLQPFYDVYVASAGTEEERRAALLTSLLLDLKPRRKLQQALQALSAAAKTDAAFGRALLDNQTDGKYVLHAARDSSRPALDDLSTVERPGLSARFFFRDTATGAPDHNSDAEGNLAYSATGSNRLPDDAGNPLSGVWSGCLEVPENGFYNLLIEAEAGATVTLDLDHESVMLDQNDDLWSNHDPIELRAGTLYAISLKVEKVKDTLNVRWETEGRGREIVPARYLYSATLLDDLRQTQIHFLKAASLAAALGLTAGETAHFASHADYQIGGQGWLNSLPVAGGADEATSSDLLKALNALVGFARIKADLSPNDERLLAVLKDPATTAADSGSLLFTLTRWEPAPLDSLLTRFGKVSGGNADRDALKDLGVFRRVYDAYGWVKKLGVSASALIKATTNEPDADNVRELQAALRARYEGSDWLNVLRPINDEMRVLQRDALVTFVLHQMRMDPAAEHIDTPEKLFEYFLMDLQMDPCMQTSRVRHALSSVQLFIERWLMNLEPRVAPSPIKAKHWEWMSRYRVWEANRKVFLYPENWLEPELRDDQSPFFKEAMSELLQSDITEDRAATALLSYLSKLEEVAKLEPCGVHFIEDNPDTGEIAHVVARTAGANRKYYYRRLEGGSWTPWEQIKLDIEDNPVIPVVWKGRLFLFWLRITQQAPLDPTKAITVDTPADEQGLAGTKLSQVKQKAADDATRSTKVIVQAVLCWSEYYNGKWQPTKTSDVNKPAELGQFVPAGTGAFDRSALRLWASEAGTHLRISISGQGRGASFVLYNTHSLPVPGGYVMTIVAGEDRYLDTFGDLLSIGYTSGIVIVSVSPGAGSRPILKNLQVPNTDRVIAPRHELLHRWDAPFFYEDSNHVFYVTSEQHVVPIPDGNSYSHPFVLAIAERVIPYLVLPEPPRHLWPRPLPDPFAPIVKAPDLGVIDPSIERFVSEDAYITRAIGTLGTVRFGDREIGPAGGLANPGGVH